ncbi:MAG TPA: hypothetical protein VGP51_01760 [Nocardioidaceae bacterium]|nr:hypothetical protein [Nocardioidaceae bacterium]
MSPDKVGGFGLLTDLRADPGSTRQNVGCFRASFRSAERPTSPAGNRSATTGLTAFGRRS